MLAKEERVSRLDFAKRPTAVVRFIYGSIKGFSGTPSGAVVISKKTCPTAPERNKIRRRIYSIIRPLIRSGALTKPVIVYPNKAATIARFQDLKQELEKCLAKT